MNRSNKNIWSRISGFFRYYTPIIKRAKIIKTEMKWIVGNTIYTTIWMNDGFFSIFVLIYLFRRYTYVVRKQTSGSLEKNINLYAARSIIIIIKAVKCFMSRPIDDLAICVQSVTWILLLILNWLCLFGGFLLHVKCDVLFIICLYTSVIIYAQHVTFIVKITHMWCVCFSSLNSSYLWQTYCIVCR